MYDIVYIGGGLNYAGAIVAAKNGKKVALIEEDMSQLGGICLHKGCIPSKMFLHYSQQIFDSKDDILNGNLKLEMQTLVEKKNTLLQNVTKVVVKQCSGFELIEGKASITAPNTISVNGKTIQAKNIVIGTGSHPFIPNNIQYNAKDIITSDEVLNLKELPKKIAIYGTGAIGLEMASFFATSGTEVTLIYRHGYIQKNAHPSIQKVLKLQLEKLGINLLENHTISTAKSTKKGVHISFTDKSSIYLPILLIASGRLANTDVVKCNDINVEKDILTDEYFQTSLAKHYAIGDCNGKIQLAHAARAQALNVTNQILGKNPRKLNLKHIVKFIHTLPMSYAVVGDIKSDLEKSQVQYKESLVTLNQFTYSTYNHASKGVMVTYADNDGFILGAEILAPNAEELIATIAMSLAGEMDIAQAKRTILAHPTFSEALERTFYKL